MSLVACWDQPQLHQSCARSHQTLKYSSPLLPSAPPRSPQVGLSGPTIFHQLIDAANSVAAAAQCSQATQKYFVLLIITDGVINDMAETTLALAKASGLPLSLIIIGVGADAFAQMKSLDSDGSLLSSESGKHKCLRDIVQFVPMRNFVGKPDAALAAEVLAEVPSQVLQYMAMRGIMPNARRA